VKIFRARQGGGPERVLLKALKRAREYTERAPGPPADVQLLGQVSGARDWPQIFEYWTRRDGMTGGWPRQLKTNELVLNLWPLAPGTIGLTTGVGEKPAKRQPRNTLSAPWLLGFDPTEQGVNTENALRNAISHWIDDVVFEHDEFPSGLRLAPPILEEWASKGRLVRRNVLTLEAQWQLPPAEGVTWPPTSSMS
jgi:hypothetical protein